jgi:hypothetical protein
MRQAHHRIEGQLQANPLAAVQGKETEMRGDHLVVDRGLYRHHSVDLGNGAVVHFAGPGTDKMLASIRVDTLQDFARGATVWVRVYGQRLDPDETVRRAQSLVGTTGYHLVLTNCEHLASWCVTGVAESRQVERVSAGAGTATVALLASVSCADVLATIGSVGGLSGPGVMSALATVGHVAGGGAVRGLYLLGLVPGLLGTVAVMYATRDKSCLTDEERRARSVARYGAGAGGIATGIAGVGVVSTAGTVAGLSGAGITSGLAAIGSIAGGGMVAGAAVLVAVPALVAGLLGWLVYRLALYWMTATTDPRLAAGT